MGSGQSGGLSEAESAEVAGAYKEFSSLENPVHTDEPTFKALLGRAAPKLYAKAEAAGHGDAAARTLRDQFETKYAAAHRNDVGETNAQEAAALADRTPAVHENIRLGLAAGLMATYPLRTVKIRLRTHEVTAVLATASERCVVSEAAVAKCDLADVLDGAFGDRGRVHHAPVSFEGPEAAFVAAFDVVPALPAHLAAYDCVLGCDFLARHAAVLDFKAGVLRLEAASGETVEIAILYDELAQERELVEAKTAGHAVDLKVLY